MKTRGRPVRGWKRRGVVAPGRTAIAHRVRGSRRSPDPPCPVTGVKVYSVRANSHTEAAWLTKGRGRLRSDDCASQKWDRPDSEPRSFRVAPLPGSNPVSIFGSSRPFVARKWDRPDLNRGCGHPRPEVYQANPRSRTRISSGEGVKRFVANQRESHRPGPRFQWVLTVWTAP